MAETYSIQATLTAKDELSPVLDQIAKIVAKLQDVFHDLAGSKIFDAIVNDANKAINAFGRVKSAADKLGTSLGSLGGAKSGRHFGGRSTASPAWFGPSSRSGASPRKPAARQAAWHRLRRRSRRSPRRRIRQPRNRKR